MPAAYEFQPVTVESHGPLSKTITSFLVNQGSEISKRSGKPVKPPFLFQRVSMLIQCINSILYYESFPVEEDTDT